MHLWLKNKLLKQKEVKNKNKDKNKKNLPKGRLFMSGYKKIR